ncbi:hypothetical protein NW757_014569 [Fusarium falciforme]|nr:hypothetical protein NW757_014569 [Fusarium falciforme]
MNSTPFVDWIENWLQAIPNPSPIQLPKSCSLQPRGPEMTPPPSRSSNRSGSPSKRQKLGSLPGQSIAMDHQYDSNDDQATPRSASAAATTVDSRSLPIFLGRDIPSLAPTQTSNSQTEQSMGGSEAGGQSLRESEAGGSPTRGRRKSPDKSKVKNVNSLHAMDLPVVRVAQQDNPFEKLPKDVHELFTRIHAITVLRDRFIPSEIQTQFKKLQPLVPDSWFRPLEELGVSINYDPKSKDAILGIGGPTTSTEAALEELRTLRRLKADADTCELCGYSEIGWNMTVHMPLLVHALSAQPTVHVVPSLTAQLTSKFVPSAGSSVIEAKMIDFALALWLSNGKPLRSDATDQDCRLMTAITNKVFKQPGDSQTVNQTTFAPLQFAPIGCNVETKLGTAITDGRLQLGVWTAAWFCRMETFRPKGCPWVTIPLLYVVDHSWRISFACHRGDCIEILEEMDIGDTRSLVGIYQLTAVLRELASWISTTYREWIERVFLGTGGS